MRSFGRLLRKMRGVTPLSTIAKRTAVDEGYLLSVERGQIIADELLVRQILRQGFDLDKHDTTRVVLGIALYDLGLRDSDLRQLVIDLITRDTPAGVRERAKRLFRSYTDAG